MSILTSIAEKICMVLSDLISIPEDWKYHPCDSDEEYVRTHLNRGRDFLEFASDITFEGRKVLDIGCGGSGLIAFISQNGAKLSVGIDLDCDKSTKAIFGKKGIGIELVKADAREMPFFDGVFDIIVSRNVFEHIPRINLVLQECKRILKDDGTLYLQFGPIWYSRHGGHLWTVIPIPWCHLLFPKQVLFHCIQMRHSTDEALAKIAQLEGLGRITIRNFKKSIKATGWHVKYYTLQTKKILKPLTRIPFLNEFVTGSIVCKLQKEAQK